MKNFRTQKFGYDFSALTQWTDEQKLPLVVKSLFDNATARLVQKRTGIKFIEAINIMDDVVYLQDGRTCAANPTGDTAFSQVDLTVGAIKVEKSWCVADLEEYWTQIGLTPGSTYQNLPFEQAWSEFYAGLIGQVNETSLWQGDTTSLNSNLNKFDGFVKNINAGSFIPATATADVTTTNVRGIFDNMISLLPAGVTSKEDLAFMTGWNIFTILIQALRDANNFYYNGVEQNPYRTGVLDLPGYGIKVHAVHGLDNMAKDDIYLGRTSNFYIGTDLENEAEDFRIFYDERDDLVRFRTKYKLGTAVAFTNEIVRYRNT